MSESKSLALIILNFRFLKFGMVGVSGIIVNLTVLWFCQEVLLSWVEVPGIRLNLSLVLAICLSTFSNYFWNRVWTWRDRVMSFNKGFFRQMVEYYAVCWLAIALQFVFTNLFQLVVHYLAANLMAIALSAYINYRANDALTFSGHSILSKITGLFSKLGR